MFLARLSEGFVNHNLAVSLIINIRIHDNVLLVAAEKVSEAVSPGVRPGLLRA